MHIAKEIFRAYDIRGIVDKTLTRAIVFNIGRAVATKVLKAGQNQLIVGRDGRLSGPALMEQFIEGVTATGCNVLNIGQVATPVLYFSTKHLQVSSAAMLTGSHNPPDYNGIKIVLADRSIYGDDIIALYNMIQQDAFPQGRGTVITKNINQDYIDHVVGNVKLTRPLRVVVDCGNGICGDIVPKLYRALGCEVIPLYCEVDGNFPNHHPDPGNPDNLRDLIQTVQKQQADIGFSYDGDGDRLGTVDSNGKIIWADRVLMLFAQDVLQRNKGATIIYDVKSSSNLKNIISQHGGIPLLCNTGHSLIKAKMKETGAILAGEMSGHIFFMERWSGADDALYAGARLLEILAQTINNSSAEVFAKLPESISTPELAIEVTEANKFKIIEDLVNKSKFAEAIEKITIDGLRVEFANGWGLVRASNTTPKLILRFEAQSLQYLQKIQEEFKHNILQIAPLLQLPF
jgi:phosphomannomutase/phosphoglucomutase